MGESCTRCRRPLWDGGGPITFYECTGPGVVCSLVSQKNSLVAALASVVTTPHDPAVVRTARAVLEHYTGVVAPPFVSPSCPKCQKPGVVTAKNVIRVHYPKPEDTRPCVASLRNYKDGTVVGL